MSTRQGRPPDFQELRSLTEEGQTVPIGTIAWCLRSEEQASGEYRVSPSRHATTTMRIYREHYGDRADFSLWERGETLLSLLHHPNDHLVEEVREYMGALQAGIADENAVVAWGVAALVPHALRKSSPLFKRSPALAESAKALAITCAEAFESGLLEPIPGSRGGCTLTRVLLEYWSRKLRSDAGEDQSLSVAAYIGSLLDDLQVIDHTWRPGGTLSFRRIRKENARRCGLMPGHTIDMSRPLAMAMLAVRPGLSREIEEVDDLSGRLLETAALLAQSAHGLLRSMRRAERLKRADRHWIPRHDPRTLLHQDLYALEEAAKSARAAGMMLTAVRYDHLFLQLLVKLVVELQGNARGLDGRRLSAVVAAVKRAGYEADPRWEHAAAQVMSATPTAMRFTQSSGVAAADEQGGAPATTSEAATPVESALTPVAQKSKKGVNLHHLWVQYHQRKDGRWRRILGRPEIGNVTKPQLVFDSIVAALEEGHSTLAEDDLVAAATLAAQYADLESAMQMFRRAPATPHNVVLLARCLHEMLSSCAAGLDVVRFRGWQEILRAKWAETLIGATCGMGVDPYSSNERLAIHEALVGRVITTAAAAPAPADVLSRAAGVQAEDEVREALYDGPGGTFRGPGTVLGDHLRQVLRAHGSDELGRPAAVSLAAVDPYTISILAYSSRNSAISTFAFTEPVAEVVERVLSTYPAWSDGEVDWGEEFQDLAGEILRTAQRSSSDSEWVMLVPDPVFAGLPWQNLFVAEWGKEAPLVSILPSLTWLEVADHLWEDADDDSSAVPTARFRARGVDHTGRKRNLVYKLSDAEDLTSFAEEVQRQATSLLYHDPSISLGLVVGHGHWTGPESVPAIEIADRRGPRSLTWRDWMHLADRRMCFVHSCHGGRSESIFLGDMGSLPAITLGFGCRAFIAPVAEPPVETARALQRELASISEPLELGARYLRAMREDSRVSLYNFFGFADEPLWWRSTDSPRESSASWIRNISDGSTLRQAVGG